MLNTLMDISEAESGAMKLDLQKVNLASLGRDNQGLYEDVANEKGVSLSFEGPESLLVHGDPARLSQVLANLLDNAVKYTPSGGKVEVKIGQQGNRALVFFSDNGMGIGRDE